LKSIRRVISYVYTKNYTSAGRREEEEGRRGGGEKRGGPCLTRGTARVPAV
jgi:hypothetical protein